MLLAADAVVHDPAGVQTGSRRPTCGRADTDIMTGLTVDIYFSLRVVVQFVFGSTALLVPLLLSLSIWFCFGFQTLRA